jgi:hypothetical protein
VDQAIIALRLAEVERQVVYGEKAVLQQRRLVARLEGGDAESSRALEVLVELLVAQMMRVAYRDSLLEEAAISF